MMRLNKDFQNYQEIVGLVSLGFVLAASFYLLDPALARWCPLANKTAWAVIEVLRLLLLLADGRGLSPYVFENSKILQLCPQICGCLWPLFSVVPV
jgi:hypothetical protein